ncbi:hypothetical protein NL676_008249 [Syzygium grande]|nr:hypothetical protein NL676_008249 [Syzygium grande]
MIYLATTQLRYGAEDSSPVSSSQHKNFGVRMQVKELKRSATRLETLWEVAGLRIGRLEQPASKIDLDASVETEKEKWPDRGSLVKLRPKEGCNQLGEDLRHVGVAIDCQK